jgi:hypothetical protein
MCDNIMELVMKKMGLTIPKFEIERNIFLKFTKVNLNEFSLEVNGEDWEMDDFSFIKNVAVYYRNE